MSAKGTMLKLLKKDENWIRFRTIVQNSWPSEFDNLEAELMNMHKARPLRNLALANKTVGAKSMSKASLVDQGYRSRAIEICMEAYRKKVHIEAAKSLVCKHIESAYKAELKSLGYTTQRDKHNFLALLVNRADDIIAKFQTLLTLADYLIDDIDQGAFALKRSIDSLSLGSKREYVA